MKPTKDPLRVELRLARRLWPDVQRARMEELRLLIQRHRLSVALGEIMNLNNHWYVTHSGLLQLAFRRRCCGIKTTLEERLSDPLVARWIFKATVYKSSRSRGFVGFGDADPSNVSSLVSGAEMRVAETRAVNRALRKAYGIGLCSVEELGGFSTPPNSSNGHREFGKQEPKPANGSTNGQPRLRDQLCLLIRQYNLDPTLVKAYAADFCGTETLSGASRDLVESFISHVAAAAKENRDALVCKLNSYSQPQEARS
jgi:hypothetical protein